MRVQTELPGLHEHLAGVGLVAADNQSARADFCDGPAREAEWASEIQLTIHPDLGRARCIESERRRNDVAAAQHVQPAGVDAQRAAAALGDDVLVRIADRQ